MDEFELVLGDDCKSKEETKQIKKDLSMVIVFVVHLNVVDLNAVTNMILMIILVVLLFLIAVNAKKILIKKNLLIY